MPKLVVPKSVKKPEFTDYTMAPETEMSLAMRKSYEASRHNIALRRNLKTLAAIDNPETCRRVRAIPFRVGYPTKRKRDEDIPSHRGAPHSNFLERYKLIDRIAYSEVLGEYIYSVKVMVLHATRGWKVFA